MLGSLAGLREETVQLAGRNRSSWKRKTWFLHIKTFDIWYLKGTLFV